MKSIPGKLNRSRRPIAAGVIAAATFAILGCGSSSSSTPAASVVASSGNPKLAGLRTPAQPEFPLQLKNYNGRPVNIKDFQGKAVLVTFLYTRCPDVCPIIVGNLRVALNELGPQAKDVQIIAVSVDPKGDTPATVSKFLDDHQMTGRMDWLIGSRPQLETTWKDWGIAAKVPKNHPEAVEHSAEIFGIDASGTLQTLYPANFKPAQIVHDVPILAAG